MREPSAPLRRQDFSGIGGYSRERIEASKRSDVLRHSCSTMERERPAAATSRDDSDAPASDPISFASSFEDFFEVEHDGLLGALYLITGNRHDAEELMQEAFVKVWEKWDLVQSLANPTGYLYRTALNAWRMRLRRVRVAARRFIRPSSRLDAFEEVEMREDVRRGLSSLTPRQRAALVLTELLGYPPSEAARILNIMPSAVRALTTQARAALRRSMGAASE
jgi:RNA polymerase sigma factor (sigma-70 family)